MRVEKKDLEEYLQWVHTVRHVELMLPADIPPETGSPRDDGLPRWKESQEVVRCARAASTPGPNGVPYRVYNGASDVLSVEAKGYCLEKRNNSEDVVLGR